MNDCNYGFLCFYGLLTLAIFLHLFSCDSLFSHSSGFLMFLDLCSFFSNKISKIRDTFATSDSFNDALDSVPPAFNAFMPVTEDEVY